MRVPLLRWDRRHNVAALTVSFGRIWHRSWAGDQLILGYNAVGRLARIILVDPRRALPEGADEKTALEIVLGLLAEEGRPADLEVVQSALARAPRR